MPRKEQKKDNRQHDADQNNQHIAPDHGCSPMERGIVDDHCHVAILPLGVVADDMPLSGAKLDASVR